MRRLLLILPVVALLMLSAWADAAAAAAPEKGPRVVVLKAPSETTARTAVRIRFRSTARRTRCRLDRGRARRCRRAVRYRRLSPGPHIVKIRARRRGRTAVARVRWTVVPPPAGAPVAPPSAPSAPSAPPVQPPAPAFEDDFSGAVLNPLWDRYIGVGHGGNGLRRPSAIALDGHGSLVVTAQMVDGQLVSGGMSLLRNATYGRYEFRVRTDPDPTGTMSGAVLTWPASNRWPDDGEIDIYETGPAVNRAAFDSFVHFGASNRQYDFRHATSAATWHTMALDWRAEALNFYRDGALVWTVSDPAAIPDVAHHLAIQLDATANRTLTAPVRMYVDYVRVYG